MVQIDPRSLHRGKTKDIQTIGVVIAVALSVISLWMFYSGGSVHNDDDPKKQASKLLEVVKKTSELPVVSLQPVVGEEKSSQIHVVFSTACSLQHDWQSYLFFFHAMMHKQSGTVTRVVSGCNDEQEQIMKKLHDEQISVMSDQFHIHFTPEFGKIPGRSYEVTKYWNKPFGVKHWLENVFGYQYEGEISTIYDDDIIVLVDPDMYMQRPFVNDFSRARGDFWHPYILKTANLYDKVSHGKPIAQTYSFGNKWFTSVDGHMEDVVGAGSPALTVSKDDASVTFSAGPPYMLTARDMYRLSYHWAKFLPTINEYFKGMMAEMYGYCMAAAHLNLRHQIAVGFMISDVEMNRGEGWAFLDNVTDDACQIEKFADRTPHVIHICQRYAIGEYFLSKYKVPTGFLECNHTLFELPPPNIAAYTKYSHYGDGSITNYTDKKMVNLYRQAFVVCSLMDGFNKAARFFKDHNCPNGANYEETWNHFREEKIQKCTTVHGCPK